MKFSGKQLVKATGGRLTGDAGPGSVQTDTRMLTPGSWFVALIGERFNGHAFLEQAYRQGAVGAVVSEPVPETWDRAVVHVSDTTRALQELGLAARRRFAGPVVGLTGSSGKTTTRAMVGLALGALGPIHQTAGNLNNHLGVPMTLLAIPASAAGCVVELGTSGPGEIAVLAAIAEPNVRLVLNVGPAHLQELGSLQGVAREKGALVRTARAGDIVCLNDDDPLVQGMPTGAAERVIRFGASVRSDIRLVSAQVDGEALVTRASYHTPQGLLRAVLPCVGVPFAHNGAAALAVALALGVDLAQAAHNLQHYQPVGMRQRIQTLPSGVTVVNDAYNANPASMEAALRALAAMGGRRFAVVGDMLELGPGASDYHRAIATLAGQLGLDGVVFVGPHMQAASGACEAPWVRAVPTAQAVPALLNGLLAPGDRLLVKGSRGVRLETVVANLQNQKD